MAEREGFEPLGGQWDLQVADPSSPGAPAVPFLPSRITQNYPGRPRPLSTEPSVEMIWISQLRVACSSNNEHPDQEGASADLEAVPLGDNGPSEEEVRVWILWAVGKLARSDVRLRSDCRTAC